MFMPPSTRRRTLGFVEMIAKWSMADVFVVALFITYLAAEASQSAGGSSLLHLPRLLAPAFIGFCRTACSRSRPSSLPAGGWQGWSLR